MRSFLRNIALAAFALWASHANALPMTPIQGDSSVTQIQLQCTTASCIDPQTGVYTQSTCDRYGCRPSSGPVGRLGPGGGYRNGPPLEPPPSYYGRQYGRGDYGGGGGGGFDCNASRCIDGNGRVWESTCNRRGCRPLRPARGSRW